LHHAAFWILRSLLFNKRKAYPDNFLVSWAKTVILKVRKHYALFRAPQNFAGEPFMTHAAPEIDSVRHAGYKKVLHLPQRYNKFLFLQLFPFLADIHNLDDCGAAV